MGGRSHAEAGYYGTEMGNTQVGVGTCEEAGDYGTDTGNAQMGGGSCAVLGKVAGVGMP